MMTGFLLLHPEQSGADIARSLQITVTRIAGGCNRFPFLHRVRAGGQ
jgi:hypothetical protein